MGCSHSPANRFVFSIETHGLGREHPYRGLSGIRIISVKLMATHPRHILKLRPLVLLASGFALVMAALAWGSVALLPQTAYYPHMLISQGNAMSFEFFMTGQLERFDCDKLLAAMRK